MYVKVQQMQNSTRNLVVVSIIIIIGVSVVVVYFGIHYSDCDTRFEQLEQRRMSLDTRANSLGGILDFGGELEAETNQYNVDVGKYNAECG